MCRELSDCRQRWLGQKAQLQPRTLSTYVGELHRFEEFCFGRRVVTVEGLSEQLLLDYFAQLRNGRAGVRSKRVESLGASSAQQAERITRAFLKWLRDERFIAWSVAERKAPTGDLAADTATRARRGLQGGRALRDTLLKEASSGESEAQMRTLLTLQLVFWGALKPAEVSALTVADMTRLPTGLVRISAPHLNAPRFVPANVWGTWALYRQRRETRHARPLSNQDFIVGGLRQEAALTEWSIWSIIKSSKLGPSITPRALRAEFLHRITGEASAALSLARKASGLPRLQPTWASGERQLSTRKIASLLERVVV